MCSWLGIGCDADAGVGEVVDQGFSELMRRYGGEEGWQGEQRWKTEPGGTWLGSGSEIYGLG